jgi:hypothetical protein
MTNTIQVFVPVGVVSTASVRDSASRHVDRSDFVVGMLDNHKHGSTQILDRLQQRLEERFGVVHFVRLKKPDAGKGASKQVIEDLARNVASSLTASLIEGPAHRGVSTTVFSLSSAAYRLRR